MNVNVCVDVLVSLSVCICACAGVVCVFSWPVAMMNSALHQFSSVHG